MVLQQQVPNILIRLAQRLGAELKNGRLEIPERFGNGYCSGYVFNEHIRLLISNYELKEEIVVENPDAGSSPKMIFFKFQHIFPRSGSASGEALPVRVPSVLVATSRINTDHIIAIHSNTEVINIEVDAGYLKNQFNVPDKSVVLRSLLQNTQPLLFEQVIYPSVQRIVDEIVLKNVDEMFKPLFLRVKAEELICNLLMELEQREELHLYALNKDDISAVYKAKESMLAHLNTPPAISSLALGCNMSPSKLKRLFKQIFGISIFQYYQEFRMKEAARLLRDEKLSVSAAGSRLGFTNLSHFSRIFEHHIGVKPKRYTLM